MKNFIKFISHILNRPTMHGVKRIEDLSLIILGYRFGCANSRDTVLNNKIEKLLKELTKNLRQKFDKSSLNENNNWVEIIRKHSISDDDSIKIFLENWILLVPTVLDEDE